MNKAQRKVFLDELQQLRIKMGLSQEDFGRLFGMERVNYNRLETGRLITIPRVYVVTLEMVKMLDRAGSSELLRKKINALWP